MDSYTNHLNINQERYENMATTLRISDRREKMAEAIALQASVKCNRIVKVSEVLNFIIDRYLNLEHETLIIKEFIEKDLKTTKTSTTK